MEHLAVAEASSEDRLAARVRDALASIDAGAEVVLVTTRNLQSADFDSAAAPGDRGACWPSSGIRIINTADKALSQYFQPV